MSVDFSAPEKDERQTYPVSRDARKIRRELERGKDGGRSLVDSVTRRNETTREIRQREEPNEVTATTSHANEEIGERKEITLRNYLNRFPVMLLLPALHRPLEYAFLVSLFFPSAPRNEIFLIKG